MSNAVSNSSGHQRRQGTQHRGCSEGSRRVTSTSSSWPQYSRQSSRPMVMGELSTTVVSFVALHSTTIHFGTFQSYINKASHSVSGVAMSLRHTFRHRAVSVMADQLATKVLMQASLTDAIAGQRRGISMQVQQTCTRRVPANVGGGLPLACIDCKVSCTLVDADHLHRQD